MQITLREAAKMAQEIHHEIIAHEEAAREREAGEPAYPAFDTVKPTDAERIAALEARVAALETRVNVKRGNDDAWKPLGELFDFITGAESGALSLKSKPIRYPLSWCEHCQAMTEEITSAARGTYCGTCFNPK